MTCKLQMEGRKCNGEHQAAVHSVHVNCVETNVNAEEKNVLEWIRMVETR